MMMMTMTMERHGRDVGPGRELGVVGWGPGGTAVVKRVICPGDYYY